MHPLHVELETAPCHMPFIAARCKALKYNMYYMIIDFMSYGEYNSRINVVGDYYLNIVNIIHSISYCYRRVVIKFHDCSFKVIDFNRW